MALKIEVPPSQTVTTVEQLRDVYRKCSVASSLGMDTESYGRLTLWQDKPIVDSLTGQAAGISISDGKERWYIVRHHGSSEYLPDEKLISFVKGIFELDIPIGWWNWDYDCRIIHNLAGQRLKPKKLVCCQQLAHITGTGAPVRYSHELTAFSGGSLQGTGDYEPRTYGYEYGLKPNAKYHLGIEMPNYEETVGKEKVQTSGPTDDEIAEECTKLASTIIGTNKRTGGLTKKDLAPVRALKEELKKKQEFRQRFVTEIPLEDAAEYASLDAFATWHLLQIQLNALKEMGYEENYFRVNAPFLDVVRDFHDHGAFFDQAYINRAIASMNPEVKQMEDDWKSITGVSISSNKECAKALYEDLKAWPISGAPRTPGGALAINKLAMRHAFENCPQDSLGYKLAKLKSQYNKLSKLLNTYSGSLLEQLKYRDDGRLRGHFGITATANGRLSCKDPNLQNIPQSNKIGLPDIRHAFISEPGWSYLDSDFSQLETVITAHFTGCLVLRDALLNGADMHTNNANKLGVDRNKAKTAFYAYLYGCHAKKLAVTLSCSVDEATHIIEGFDIIYEAVVSHREKVKFNLLKHGYVSTLLGRRRWFPDFGKTSDKYYGFAMLREACNAEIQGSAADIAMVAGVNIRKYIVDNGLHSKIILQNHDEYLLECPNGELEQMAAEMPKLMIADTCGLSLPLGTSTKIGTSWSEAK